MRKGAYILLFSLATFMFATALVSAAPPAGKSEIIVTKTVVNDNGGTAVSGDFTMNVTGTNATPNSFAGSSTGTSVILDPGSYSVDESAMTGYTKTLGAGCFGTIAADETKNCTITNDDNPTPPAGKGTLVVTKTVVNDNGGTKNASEFTLNVTGTNASPSSFPGNTTGTTVTLDPGTYSVGETAVNGYLMSLSADCVGSIAAGQTKNCTVTNNDVTPPPPGKGQITVSKTVINNNGGTQQADDFTMTVTGTNVSDDSFPGSSTGTTVTLDPGAYSVGENLVTNYAMTLGASCTGTIAAGETKFCTVTNDDVAGPPSGKGQLTVIKTVVNNNGGTKQSSDFTMNVSGSGVSDDSFPGSSTGTTVTLNPGVYSVDETAMTGYTKSLSNNCNGTITAGESKTCTVTNDDNPPTPSGKAALTVIKKVVNDDNGTKLPSDFTMNVTAVNPSMNSFAGNSTGTTIFVDPGSFTVGETSVSGYTMTLSSDCSGTVAAGDSKTCTVTNNDNEPVPSGQATLIVKKHVINDNGGSKSASDFTMSVTGTNVSDNSFAGDEDGTTVTLDAGSYSVNESIMGGYVKSFSADCDGTITAGTTKTCTITNNDIGPTPNPDTCAGFTDVLANNPHCLQVTFVQTIGAMLGNPDGTFAGNSNLQRDQVAKIILETFDKFDPDQDYCNGVNPFPDVTPSAWSYQYICRGKQLGMITGYLAGEDAGMYRPGRSVNRAEFLALVLRNLNETMPSVNSTSYEDVVTGQWYASYAKYSMDHNLYEGNRLYPTQFATRFEVADVLYKLYQQGKIR